MFHSADGDRYAKHVPPADAPDPRHERDRITWLAGQGVPGPRVLDWHSGETGACLVTSTVPGVPGDLLSAEDLGRAWPNIADAVR